jgi:hypothetical protein
VIDVTKEQFQGGMRMKNGERTVSLVSIIVVVFQDKSELAQVLQMDHSSP